MGKIFPIIIAHANFLDENGPSLMSFGSNATANGYTLYILLTKV